MMNLLSWNTCSKNCFMLGSRAHGDARVLVEKFQGLKVFSGWDH